MSACAINKHQAQWDCASRCSG